MPEWRNIGDAKTFSVVTATTTAQILVESQPPRKAIQIFNLGSVTVYIGKDDSVTSANGYPILSNTGFLDRESGDAYWIIAASGTADTRVMVVTSN